MLNPNSRSLYTSALTPPPGMIFDEAIATTFSMDPALLLEAPVYLALMTANGQADPDPLSILEAIRRYSKKISVYVQKGRIHVPQIAKPNPLFGFLEEMVIEVTAPNGGVFHPKVWAIRFVSSDRSSSMLRLVVLTRNMTTDQSWDLSLQLEGTIGGRKIKLNRPLSHFFKLLPGLATGNHEKERIEQANRFSDEMYRVQWELPDGFEELAFYLPGTKEFEWEPPKANRMAVISPFCSDDALQSLVKITKAADALISRPESLSGLKKDTLKLFSQCLHLDEAAETEDGEEDNPTDQPLATGLHAKVYLFETRHYSDYTHVVMGSANATNAAMNASKNIEILVGLIGRKNKVGGIDELLGADGLGEYLVAFDTTKEAEIDTERQQAEAYIEKARLLLSEADLSIKCRNASKCNLWALTLTGHIPSLDGIISVTTWPITVTRDFAVNILVGNVGGVELGEFSASSVTGLIAFELKTNHPDVSARFVLNFPASGIPDERNSAIVQTIINNQDGFIRYLLLLLGNDSADGLIESGSGSGLAKWLSRLAKGEEIPLLEELTRAYNRYPDRLLEIAGLVRELSSHDSKSNVIPNNFLKLWSVFESAIGGRDG